MIPSVVHDYPGRRHARTRSRPIPPPHRMAKGDGVPTRWGSRPRRFPLPHIAIDSDEGQQMSSSERGQHSSVVSAGGSAEDQVEQPAADAAICRPMESINHRWSAAVPCLETPHVLVTGSWRTTARCGREIDNNSSDPAVGRRVVYARTTVRGGKEAAENDQRRAGGRTTPTTQLLRRRLALHTGTAGRYEDACLPICLYAPRRHERHGRPVSGSAAVVSAGTSTLPGHADMYLLPPREPSARLRKCRPRTARTVTTGTSPASPSFPVIE